MKRLSRTKRKAFENKVMRRFPNVTRSQYKNNKKEYVVKFLSDVVGHQLNKHIELAEDPSDRVVNAVAKSVKSTITDLLYEQFKSAWIS